MQIIRTYWTGGRKKIQQITEEKSLFPKADFSYRKKSLFLLFLEKIHTYDMNNGNLSLIILWWKEMTEFQ